MTATHAATGRAASGRGRFVRMTAQPDPGGSTCVCGQALDCCHTSHCPRCGISLGAA